MPPPIATFLLTSERSAEAIIAQQRHCRTNTLQLCDYVPVEVHRQLRAELPGIGIVQVVHVTGPDAMQYGGLILALAQFAGRLDGSGVGADSA